MPTVRATVYWAFLILFTGADQSVKSKIYVHKGILKKNRKGLTNVSATKRGTQSETVAKHNVFNNQGNKEKKHT